MLTEALYPGKPFSILSTDITLLLILAQIEYKKGQQDACSFLCDKIMQQSPDNLQALEMKGDICKYFCQIEQAMTYYN